MQYIGTSLGGCLQSLLANEVSENEVMVIITRTDCPDYEKFINVVKMYHAHGNIGARNSDRYEIGDYDLEKVLLLAERLWYSGKIHQPRTFAGAGGIGRYHHPFQMGDMLWWQVVPTNTNNTPMVVEAYEKYKMLDTLTKDA
jgi:hypothetical protein